MTKQTIHIDRRHPAIAEIIGVSFPAYKGNRITVQTAESVRFSGTMWEDGHRNQYRVLSIDGRKAIIPEAPYQRRSKLHETEYPIRPGYVVVRHSVGGRYDHFVIFVHPDALARFLPSQSTELTAEELIVLVATSLKSSYGGVKNLRYVEAHRKTGISAELWESTKAALISRKLLTKRGAITLDGRNALEAGGYGYTTLDALPKGTSC